MKVYKNMNLNEVTLSRKSCKINTSQPSFRWLVVDNEKKT